MLHDIVIFVLLAAVAYFISVISFGMFRPERFPSKWTWWKAEGSMIFAMTWIVMLILAVSTGMFHKLR